ncbi:MAG: ABC transporter permease [Candidatus Undinarchaeales archaeon]|jgi:putative ABC transport system permease protein|nr:ABC transporter permease [Candidatus Undinarchaeales archaeon]
MDIFGLAIRNLVRRRSRTLFLVLGIAVSIATVVAMFAITASMEGKVNSELERFGANIVVVPRSQSINLQFGGFGMGGVSFGSTDIDAESFDLIHTIKNNENLAHIAPKVFGIIEGKTENEPVIIAGVNFTEEPSVKAWWNVNGTLPEAEHEALVGADAAELFGLVPGSTISLKGQEFTVSGVLQSSGSTDDSIVFLHLPIAQELLDKQGVYTMVDVRALCNTCPIDEITRQIMEAVPDVKATPVKQVASAEMAILSSVRNFSMLISSVIILLSVLGLAGLVLSSVNERTREIGVLMSLGFKEGQIARLIIYETALMGFVGGILGFVLGVGIAVPVGPSIVGTPIIPSVTFLPIAIALSLSITLISSIYPAHQAAHLHPSDALRAL